MKTRISVSGVMVLLGGAALSAVALAAGPADMSVVSDMNDIQWGPQPPAFPPGGEMAVMSGDPAGKGFISLRARLPAGYTVPPHFHPTDEHVTVLSGTLAFGMGDELDAKAATTVKAGGYFVASAEMHHYVIATTAVVIQVDLLGPFDITYVDPADDPRNAGK